MATLTLLRACQGRSSFTLLRTGLMGSGGADVTKKSLALSSPALNMFKARRGPFTPEGKQGSGHIMTAATHWSIERAVTVGLIGILPVALFVQGPVMDYALATAVVLHGHWGLHGVASDYVVKFFPPINIFTNTLSVLAMGSLYYFNYTDVGVCKAIQMVWGL